MQWCPFTSPRRLATVILSVPLLTGSLFTVPLLSVPMVVGSGSFSPVLAQGRSQASFMGQIRSLLGLDREGNPTGRSQGGSIRDGACLLPTAVSSVPDRVVSPPRSGSGQVGSTVAMTATEIAATEAATEASTEAIAAVPTEILALVPATEIGTTVQGHPTFWLYIPISAATHRAYIEFQLLDGDFEKVTPSAIRLSLPEQPGLVSFQLPDDQPELAENQSYWWSFTLVCAESQGDIPQEINLGAVWGPIERVPESPTLAKDLADRPETEHYVAYLEQGIWYDMVNHLAETRGDHPQEWVDLMATFGLTSMVEQTPVPLEPPSPAN